MDLEAVRKKAYAPYSNFQVAALVVSDAGTHFGTNMENAAYPEGICAEGAALSAMTTAGGRYIKSIEIVGPSGVSIRPCGGCRQKILEFADDNTEIKCQEADGSFKKFTIREMLPNYFGMNDLN